ncbi:MAG: hypothetical protein R3309_16520 [Reinekea sp.]|jgi:hypothetical protein|nr:hypothetical protein [Reinekea sp.]
MTKYWEIVQLSDGSFALQSSEENEAPLVRIEFSPEAESLLQGQVVDVARAMIGAGVQAASFVEDASVEDPIAPREETVH